VSPLNSRTAAKFQRQKVNSDTIILGLNEEVKKQGNSLQLEEMKVNFFLGETATISRPGLLQLV